MCGREERLVLARIEGAEIDVCTNCSKHGTVIRRIATSEKKPVKKEIKQQKETIEEVREDYAQVIREAREKTGISQKDFAKRINEKESVVHKVEVGSLVPSLKLAAKLERELKINLIEIVEEHHGLVQSKGKSSGLTLGDVIKIKKR